MENGNQVIGVSNTALTGGSPGIIANGLAQVAGWSGGDGGGSGNAPVGGGAPSGSYSVGGVASGLSGTVVVQDNGSDDLTVSGNGSFTFDSLLAGGAAYDVTVAQIRPGVHGGRRFWNGGYRQRPRPLPCRVRITARRARRMISTGRRQPGSGVDGYEWRRAGDLLRCGGGHKRRRKLGGDQNW